MSDEGYKFKREYRPESHRAYKDVVDVIRKRIETKDFHPYDTTESEIKDVERLISDNSDLDPAIIEASYPNWRQEFTQAREKYLEEYLAQLKADRIAKLS